MSTNYLIRTARLMTYMCTVILTSCVTGQRKFNPLSHHLPPQQAEFLVNRLVAIADTSGEFLGSGFFVSLGEDESIYLVSNYHVVGQRTKLLGSSHGKTFKLSVLSRDPEYDVAVMGMTSTGTGFVRSTVKTVGLECFINERAALWPGMLTVSAAYPLDINWPPRSSPAVSFSRIAHLDASDSLIRLEGLLDLGSSGTPVFTWIQDDRGRNLHLVGMARSFQVAKALTENAGDTLVVSSRLYEVVPATAIKKVLEVTDSVLGNRIYK